MNSVLTVGQVNSYVKNMFTRDPILSGIYVKGEVSNCKYHTSGHIYFSLKDETGVLACVMFAGKRRGLSFTMKDGDKVIIRGEINVYPRDGKYQLYASEIRLEGAGVLYERFMALKKELNAAGLFSPAHKKPIPKYIKRLGVVTAPTGAAVQDIRNISLRRNPYLQIILYPALVQGEGAAQSIARGIRMLDRAGVDVIIVGRGGGSMEDLWAFNERIVATAIYECKTPVISGVGHETDETIADYVADLRASTPSAAAELAVDDYRVVLDRFSSAHDRLRRAMGNKLDLMRGKLGQYQMRIGYLSPENRLREDSQRLSDLQEEIQKAMERKLQENRHRLGLYLERFSGLSPLKKLNQGYAYAADEEGRTIFSVEQVKPGDSLLVWVADGNISARVEEVHKEELMEE